jgi:hypothetical protein
MGSPAVNYRDIQAALDKAINMTGFACGYDRQGLCVRRRDVSTALTAAGINATIEAVDTALEAAERGRQYRLREIHAENCDCDHLNICGYCRQEGCCE